MGPRYIAKHEQIRLAGRFAAFTVSTSQVEPVRQYIREQKLHHQQRDYKQELIGLLDKHEIEYDERYIWD